MQSIKVLDMHHGVEVTEFKCICSPAQVGGANGQDAAAFKFDHQKLDIGLGHPLVFLSEQSGAQLWWHYAYEPAPNANQYVEVKHFDGSIARYELVTGSNGPLLHDAATGWAGDWWRLKWTVDPSDNKTEYFYVAGNLDRVVFPNGLVENWNWHPAWTSNWPGCSGLEISYNSTTSSVVMPELTWYMVFRNLGASNTHFKGLMTHYFAQPSKYVPDPQAGSLYSAAAPADAHLVTEFVYATGVDVTLIQKYRHVYPSAIAPETDLLKKRPVLLTSYYSSGPNDGKVWTQTLLQAGQSGLATTFEYNASSTLPVTYPFALPAGVTLQTIKVTAADGRSHVEEFDPVRRRVYRTRVFPGPNGKPRTVEGDFGDASAVLEPDEVRIDRVYDATCVCQKPIRVETKSVRGGTESAARVTRYEYDPTTKMVTKVWSPNPSTAAGQPAEVSSEFDYHSEPTVWSPRWIKEQRTPDGTTRYDYPEPLARQVVDGTHGKMQGKVVRKFVAVRRQLTESTTATADISETVVFNIPGNPALAPLSYSGPSTGSPRGQVRVADDADGVHLSFLYDSVHGRMSSATVGDSQTVFTRDLWGRLSSVVGNAGSSSLSATWTVIQGAFGETYSESVNVAPAVETKYHYDFWGNPAVVLRRNVASDSAAPHKYASAPGSARQWVRSEFLWKHHVLAEVRVDRRPLDEGEGTPFGGTNPLMAVTTIVHDGFTLSVTSPNGAVSEQVFDGFGTAFLTRVKETSASNSPVLEVARTYNNDWLEPVTQVHGQPAGGAATSRWLRLTRNGAGAVISYTDPVAPAVTGYNGSLGGSLHEFSLDSLGQVVEARTLSGGTLLAKSAYAYDQLGRVMKTQRHVLGVSGSDIHWSIATYKAGRLSQLESATGTGSPVVSYSYDTLGRLLEVRDDQPSGGNRAYYFFEPNTDFINRVVRTVVGPSIRSYETAYSMDRLGRVTQVREGSNLASPQTHVYQYGSLSQVDRYTDPMLRVQTFLADAMGRGIEHVRVGNGTDLIQNLSIFTDTGLANSRSKSARLDGLGHATMTHLDFMGRPFLIQNPGAVTEPTASDPNEPHCVFATYDGLSQISLLGDGDDGKTAFKYDGLGRMIVRELLTVQPAISTFNTKDILNRDGLGRIVIAGMFGASNGSAAPGTLVSATSTVAAEQFTMDSIGRVHGEAYQFPFAVNLLQVQSSFVGADPFRTGLALQDNLPVGASATIAMQYIPDAVGRLSQMKWNRSVATSGSAMETLADYTWLGGQRLSRSVRYGGGATPPIGATAFNYDDYGRLSLIQDMVTPAGGGTAVETNKFQYEYDAASNLKKEIYAKVGGWVGDRFKYDAHHRLTEAYMGVNTAVMFPSPEQDPTGYSSASTKTRLTYGMDTANNRDDTTYQQGSSGLVTTSYVLENEVPGPSSSNRYQSAGVTVFEHDKRGNLIYDGQFYYRYDFLNRLQEVWRVKPVDATEEDVEVQTGTKFGVIEQAEALDESRQDVAEEVYDLMSRVPREHMDPTFRARLKASIRGGVLRLGTGTPAGGGGCLPMQVLPANLELHALYGYDAYNRRVVRVVIGVDTLLSTYDGWREVVEHRLDFGTLQAQPVRQYVHGSRLDEILSYRRRVQAPGPVYSWETYYLQHGGQDTATRLMNESGAVVERYEYDPYGKTTVYNGAGTEIGWANSKGLPFLWKSVHFDGETGLLYMRNRYYSVSTSRFLTVDPIGTWGDASNVGNEYGYAACSPCTLADPMGLLVETAAVTTSCGPCGPCKDGKPKMKDEAGEECCEQDASEFTLYVKSPEASVFSGWRQLLGGDVPYTGHTFIGFEGGASWGFYPPPGRNGFFANKPGVILDDAGEAYTHKRVYKVCPKTLRKIVEAVAADIFAETLPVYKLWSSMTANGSANCTTWACRMARSGGLPIGDIGNVAEPFSLATSHGFVKKHN